MRSHIRMVGAVFFCSALTATTVGLSACSSNGTSDGGTKTLTYLTHFNQSPGKDVEAKAISSFEQANPGVKVNVIAVESGTEDQKFQALASAGDPPSLYDMSSDQFALLSSKHALAPVDIKNAGLSSDADLQSQYLNGVLSGYTAAGKVYGIPSEVSDYGAWVNTKAYSEAHIPIPTTWDDVCAAGDKMLQKDSQGKVTQQAVVLPTNLSVSQVYFVDAIAHEYGGSLFSSDGKTSNLTSSPVQKAFQLVQNLVYKCHASVPSINSSQMGADRITYGSGVGGMLFTAGSWYLGTLQKQYPAVAPPVSEAREYPSVNGVSASTSYGYAWVVPAGAKNQDLAWKLAAALKSAGQDYFQQLGLFNGTKAVAQSPAASKTPFWSGWQQSLEHSSYAVGLTNSSQISDIIGNAFDAIVLKNADVGSTLQTADSQIKPLLNQ